VQVSVGGVVTGGGVTGGGVTVTPPLTYASSSAVNTRIWVFSAAWIAATLFCILCSIMNKSSNENKLFVRRLKLIKIKK